MSNRLGGKQGTAYLGTNAQQPPNWNFYPHDPTIYTYQNFSLGDLWLNTVTQQAFVLVSLERNTVTNEFNAIWTDFTGTAAGVVESLQAADLTVAFPVIGQINFPDTVITANTNEFTNILTSVQANNSNNFLINLTPEVKLRSTLNDVVTVKSVTNNNTATQINMFKTKGTIAAPLPVVATTELSDISAYGFDGTNNTIGSSIKSRVPAGGVVGLNCVESELAFSTAGSTAGVPPSILNERVVIGKDGLVRINTPTEAGSALTINGVNTNANYTLESRAAVNAGLHNAARFINTDATAGSGCQVSIDVDNQPGTTGGDPTLRFLNTGIRAIAIGIDTSTNEFVMANSSQLGLNNFYTVNTLNDQINLPEQCAFGAFLQPGLANQTGNSGAPDVLFNNVTQNITASYNPANGRFTAPQSGRYLIGSNVTVDNITAAMTDGVLQFTRYTSAGVVISQYAFNYCNAAATRNPANRRSFQGHTIIDMNATDYVTVQCILFNGAGDTAGYSGFGARETSFYGQLLS